MTTDSRHSPINILVMCWETSLPYPVDSSLASMTCLLKSPLKHLAADGMSDEEQKKLKHEAFQRRRKASSIIVVAYYGGREAKL
eukprot:679094-Ditylum_brightwellii.AAC.1